MWHGRVHLWRWAVSEWHGRGCSNGHGRGRHRRTRDDDSGLVRALDPRYGNTRDVVPFVVRCSAVRRFCDVRRSGVVANRAAPWSRAGARERSDEAERQKDKDTTTPPPCAAAAARTTRHNSRDRHTTTPRAPREHMSSHAPFDQERSASDVACAGKRASAATCAGEEVDTIMRAVKSSAPHAVASGARARHHASHQSRHQSPPPPTPPPPPSPTCTRASERASERASAGAACTGGGDRNDDAHGGVGRTACNDAECACVVNNVTLCILSRRRRCRRRRRRHRVRRNDACARASDVAS